MVVTTVQEALSLCSILACLGKDVELTCTIYYTAGYADTMKLFASGYNDGDDAIFGSKGAYQQEIVCAVESITYPLVMLLNKINGVSFSDQPADAERVNCPAIILNSDEDIAKFQGSIYLSFNPLLAKQVLYQLS